MHKMTNLWKTHSVVKVAREKCTKKTHYRTSCVLSDAKKSRPPQLRSNSIQILRDYFFLKNYVTSEGFASHDVLHYNNLWAIVKLCGCWQVLWCFLWSKGRIVCGCLSWLIAHSIVYNYFKRFVLFYIPLRRSRFLSGKLVESGGHSTCFLLQDPCGSSPWVAGNLCISVKRKRSQFYYFHTSIFYRVSPEKKTHDNYMTLF